MMGPRRIVSPEDIMQRGFGEGIYSATTPAERASELQARDLFDLQNMVINRKNKMAADILTTGKCDIKGFADDGETILVDTVQFDWSQKITPTTTWDQAGAKIYDDIKNASEMIQESAGIVPTVMIVGKNVASYMLNNDQIMKYLMVPNAQNLSLMAIAPRIESPQVMRIGMIQSLNLEVYSYSETYTDDDGRVKQFLDPDAVIIGIPGRGKQLHGAVTLINEAGAGYDTYSALYVPQYYGDRASNQMALTMYSRCIIAPDIVDDWATIKTKG